MGFFFKLGGNSIDLTPMEAITCNHWNRKQRQAIPAIASNSKQLKAKESDGKESKQRESKKNARKQILAIKRRQAKAKKLINLN